MSALHPVRPCAEFPNDNQDLHAGSRWHSSEPTSHLTALLPEGPCVAFDAAPLPPTSRAQVLAPQEPETKSDAPEGAIAVLETHALDTTTFGEELESIDLQFHEDPFLVELLPFVDRADHAPSEGAFTDETPTQKLRPLTQAVQPLVPLQFELTPLPAQVSEWAQLTAILTDFLLSQGHTRASALIGPLLNAELVDLSRLDAAILEQLQRDGVASVRGSRVVSSPNFRSSAHVFREELANGGLDENEAMFWLTQLVAALMGQNEHVEELEQTLRDAGIAGLLERAA